MYVFTVTDNLLLNLSLYQVFFVFICICSFFDCNVYKSVFFCMIMGI